MEAAIHFLYGQLPKITIDNAGDVFEIAEFLMIEELKASCIQKMKAVPVTLQNCLKLFLLMSTYDFYFQDVSDFILSHLTELFTMDEMLLLNKESIRYIITEPILSYVSREDCFRFLLKWTKLYSSRQSDFSELLSCLDSVNMDILNTVDLSYLSERNKLLCTNIPKASNMPCDVLLAYPPETVSGKKFYAYNFEMNTWFQSLPFQDNYYWPITGRATMKNQNTITRLSHKSKKVLFYNIQNKTLIEKSVEAAGCDEMPELKHLNLINNRLYCVRNVTHYIEKLVDEPIISLEEQFVLMVRDRFPRRVRRQRMEGCCLYEAEDEDDFEIKFQPLISMCGTAKSFCCLDGFACLLMNEMKELLIYAVNECSITKIDLSEYTTDEMSYIYPYHEGGLFVVTKAGILQIDIRMKGSEIISSIIDTWLIKKAEDKEYSEYWRSRNYPPRFEIVNDKIITITRCPEKYEYKFYYQMLPKEICLLDKEEKIEIVVPDLLKHDGDVHFIQMRLPKDSLRCHVDCPHCKHRDQVRYERDIDSDEYVCYADSDDDNMPDFYSGPDYYDDSSDDSYIF